MEERRSHERYAVKCLVDIVTSAEIMKGATQNISGDGAFILCDQPLKPRENVKLTVEFPDGLIMNILAKVVWSRSSDPDGESRPQGMGVRFLW